MATNYNPQIVTDGLVLYLDAANNKSYPGTGTTWTDLSGNGNNGTLINGPTYSSDNLGNFSFDGVDDSVDIGPFSYTSFSISLIVKPGSTQSTYASIFDNNHNEVRNFFVQQDVDNTNNYYFGMATSAGFLTIYGIDLPVNTWNHLVFTYANNEFVKYYKNGVLTGTSSAGGTPVYNSPFLRIGRSNWPGRHWNGDIGTFSTYNRALSADEIKQNFNALRGRYGI